ncbi:S1C family serine protease [Sphaerotilus sp.]|uniref:S1C family serine protease n=1 Tax=Sphaerotilus sp. TaxID=2093942 RepID=UPI0034E2EAD3
MNRCLVCLVVAAATTAHAQSLTPAQVYAKVSPSVWRVSTYDLDGLPLSQGSGVVTAAEAVVTNCHVLKGARQVAVRREKQKLPATLMLWDVQRDVCQLRVPGLAAPAVALADTARFAVGQPVYAIGNPKGLELTMSDGLLSALRKDDAGRLILLQTSAAISGGSSGGGLFDERGALMGLTTLASVKADTQNLNFAIPIDWIRELPARHTKLNAGTAGQAAAVP